GDVLELGPESSRRDRRQLRGVALALDTERALERAASLGLDQRHEIPLPEEPVEQAAQVRRREVVELALAGCRTGDDERAVGDIVQSGDALPGALERGRIEAVAEQPLEQREKGDLPFLVDVEVDQRI